MNRLVSVLLKTFIEQFVYYILQDFGSLKLLSLILYFLGKRLRNYQLLVCQP